MPSFWKRKDAGKQAKEGGIAPAKIAKAAPVGAEDGQKQVYFVTITYPPQVRFSMEPDSSDSNISFSEDDFRALLKDIRKVLYIIKKLCFIMHLHYIECS